MSYLGTSPLLIYKNGKLTYSSEILKVFAITLVSSSKSIFMWFIVLQSSWSSIICFLISCKCLPFFQHSVHSYTSHVLRWSSKLLKISNFESQNPHSRLSLKHLYHMMHYNKNDSQIKILRIPNIWAYNISKISILDHI